MITLDTYTSLFEKFISKEPHSWVHFEKKTLSFVNSEGQQIEKMVSVPALYEQPHYLMRLIYSIFEFVLQTKKTTAQELVQAFKESVEILPPSTDPSSLLHRISKATEITLKKLAKKNSHLVDMLKECKKVSRNNNLICYTNDLSCLDGTHQFMPSAYTCAYSIDQEPPNSPLFDSTYLISLVHYQGIHPDINSLPLEHRTKTAFISFLSALLHNDAVIIGIGILSQENTERVRQMILAILNTLQKKKNNPDCNELYASVITQIMEALTHCSNGVNTAIENVFIDLALPKDGSLGYQIKVALQLYRDTLFRRAIHHYVRQSPYYYSHETATINYYYRKMANELGLLPSVSCLDDRYESYAMPYLKDKIRSYLKEHYTPQNAVRHIHDIINNPFDPMIASKTFTDWVLTQYPQTKGEDLLDEEGKYHPMYVTALLEDLEIII